MASINFSTMMDNTEEQSETVIIEVRGKISNVRWLETEYKAKKQRYSQRRYNNYVEYTQYVIEMPDGQGVTDLIHRLQHEQEYGAGIWFEVGQ